MQNEWSSSINDRHRLRLKGPGDRQPVKSLLVGSRELLVDSLFNLAPLLDRALAGGLLSQENYYDVRAERTPQGRARRLLEVVHAELDEARARAFLDCLRGCQQHYPRLRAWLSADRDLQRGPAECQLQAQVSVLCARLGYSVLPLSLALFSGGTLTQFELDLVQAAPTTYQQTHQLLSICLAKGEKACCSFYQALSSEDPQLASEITGDPGVGGLAEALPAVSVVRDVPPIVPVVRDVPPAPPVVRDDPAVAVQETTEETDPHSGVLLQVLDQLGVTPGGGGGPQLNVCELGVAVGLPRRTVREGLLEEAGGGLGDVAQLRALVAMFLVKTQDAARLLSRVGECSTQRVLLSGRGRLLLKQLVEAESLLRTGAPLSGNHFREGGASDPGDRVWSIFSFLLGDIMAEVLEDCGGGERGGDPKASVRLLLGNERVEAELLRELEECWREGETESLLQSVAVLGQLLRDLHPLQDSLWLSPPAEGAVYSCRPRRLHRVTSFQGVPPRVVRKALGPGAAPGTAPLPSQYREVCLCIARLLDRVQPQGGAKDLSGATAGAIAEHIRCALSQPAFGPQAFDTGMRCRVASVLEFDPARLDLPTLLELHRDTLQGLGRYLTPGERHSFQLVPEAVRMLGSAELRWAGRVRGPVAIDNGIEEVLRFVTSDPASFLVRVVCRGYDGGRYFEAREPGCVRVSGLGEEGVEEVQAAGGTVLAVEGDAVWVREGRTELEKVSQRHSAQVSEEGCCFKVTSSGSECEVKVVCKSGKVWAVAERNCEVL